MLSFSHSLAKKLEHISAIPANLIRFSISMMEAIDD